MKNSEPISSRDDYKLWAIAAAGLLMIVALYSVFFVIAARHPVESVPLERPAGS